MNVRTRSGVTAASHISALELALNNLVAAATAARDDFPVGAARTEAAGIVDLLGGLGDRVMELEDLTR